MKQITSNNMYLSKSKITDFKNYSKYNYTKNYLITRYYPPLIRLDVLYLSPKGNSWLKWNGLRMVEEEESRYRGQQGEQRKVNRVREHRGESNERAVMTTWEVEQVERKNNTVNEGVLII